MAHKKGVGSSNNGRDSHSKRLGVKLFGGQLAIAGNIIVRQRGTRFHPGENVYMGKDFTLHAKVDGTVAFKKRQKNRTFVNIIPFEEVAETVAKIKKAPPKAKATPKPEPKKEVAPKPEAKAKATPKPKKEAAPKAKATPKPVAKKEVAPKAKAKVEKKTPAATPTPASAAPAEKKPAKRKKKIKEDDLKIVEGVGPKIETLLKDAGISNLAALAEADVSKITEVLATAGNRYKMHDPTTWPKQAEIAASGDWEKLKEYQDHLKGGKDPDAK